MNPDLPKIPVGRVEEFRRRHRTGLVALVFTDLVDSVALRRQLGDQVATSLLQTHRRLVRDALARFPDAEEIETAGDSFLLLLPRPSDAVKFAVLIQRQTRALASERGLRLAVRMGIHVGEVVIEQHEHGPKPKDLYGTQVDLCARVMGLAEGGQILLTRGVFDSARQALKGEDIEGVQELSWLNYGPYLLKGIEEAEEVCEVGEVGISPLKAPAGSEKAQRQVAPESEPVLGWRPALGQAVPHTQWILEKKLGEGGFGEVWLGRHQKLKERRVFKFCFRADRVRSLKREMTLFRLIKERIGDHPNIVRLLEVYFEEPPFYVVMDHVEGQDLKAWCEQQGGADKVPLAARLEIVAQIADAMQAAHDAGVIHRDVKPANILVSGQESGIGSQTADGSTPPPGDSSSSSAIPHSALRIPHSLMAKLTDFGIGQVVSEEVLKGVTKAGFTQTIVAESSSSQTGSQMYMAPELLAGKPASTRSDIYSLGVVLYQLLVGDLTRPLTTDWVDHISDPLLRDDLKHCFAGNPQDRFAGAGQLAKHLRALPERQAVLEKQQATLAAAAKAAYRRGIVRTAAFASVIVLTIAALALMAVRLAGARKTALLNAQRLLYAAEMNLAQQAWEDGHVGQALELLNDHRPKAGQEDLRGFEWRFLWQLAQGDAVATLRGHTDYVQCVAVSPDGKMLASGGGDSSIKLWDVAARRELAILETQSGDIRSVEFSPDGKTQASGAADGSVKLWDVATHREIAAFTNSDSRVERVAFSSDSRLVAAGLGNGWIRIWDVRERREAVALQGRPLSRPSVAFSSDGKTLAAGSGDHEVKLWDFVTRRELATLEGHTGMVVFVAFSPDGSILASSGTDSTIKLWDVHSRREIVTLRGHKAWVSSATFSPDGKTLVSACMDGAIKLWDVTSRQELTTLRGHNTWVNNAVFFPDGKMLASASDDRTVKLWDATPKPSVNLLGGHTNTVNGFELSPDGKSLITSSEGGTVKLWNVASQREVASLVGHTNTVYSVAFSPDGRTLASAGNDNLIRLWDVATQRQTATLQGHTNGVNRVVFSPDGKLLASGSGDEPIRLWDVATHRQLVTLEGHTGWPNLLVFSPDGSTLATGSSGEGSIRLWDVRLQRQVANLIGHRASPHHITFSPDGTTLASLGSTEENSVMLWNLTTKTKQATLQGRTGRMFDMLFLPDGRTLATSEDKLITLWDLTARQPRATLTGHSGWVVGLALSPDGKTLASAGNDGNLKLWNLTALREVATMPERVPPNTWRVGFSSDGNTLVAHGEDRLLRIWRAPTFAEIEAAEKTKASAP